MTEDSKAKMGRPKIANPQDKTLPKVRVTEDQLNVYRAKSKAKGKTLSAWVRDCLDKDCES